MPRKITQVIALLLCLCLLFEQTGFAQVLPSALNPSLSSPPLLRYLSVNSANPFNYFNFLLDKGLSPSQEQGLSPQGTVPDLTKEAKKLIHYFFLGITLPDKAFWVNLRPDEPGRITSEELSQTDLGKVLLEQDLKLKKDGSKLLHPHHPKGKEFWTKLYEAIGKHKAKQAKITTSNRVWIVPDKAVVLETEDGALVVEAKLKVLLENEYFSSKKGLSPSEQEGTVPVKALPVLPKGTVPEKKQEQNIQTISETLMKELILPEITNEVNTSPNYAPLRQIYHSLILAQWYKRKIKYQIANIKNTNQNPNIKPEENIQNPYEFAIDKGYTKGLESELPWSKQVLWQEYLESYQKGEYKLKDRLAGLNRMYFSGGIDITKGIEITFYPSAASPLTTHEIQQFNQNMFLATATGNSVSERGVFPKTEIDTAIPDKIIKQEASSPGLAADKQSQSKPTGASFLDEGEKSASSAVSTPPEFQNLKMAALGTKVAELKKLGKLGNRWSEREVEYSKEGKGIMYDNETFGLHLYADDRILYEDDDLVVIFGFPKDESPYSFLTYHSAGKQKFSVAIRFKDDKFDEVLAGYNYDSGRAEGITPEAVALLLDKKEVPFKDFLKNRLNLPIPNEELIRRQKQLESDLARKRQEIQDLINRTKDYRNKVPRGSKKVLQEDVITVLQHEAAVIRRDEGSERYLQTFGADPCLILTIYDTYSKTAALAHIDGLTDIPSSIPQMIARMKISDQTKNLEARIIGGYEKSIQSTAQIMEIIETLKDYDVNIIEVTLKSGGQEGDALIIDSETGEVFNMIGVPQLDPHEFNQWQMRIQFQIGKTPLNFIDNPESVKKEEVSIRKGLPEDFPKGIVENSFAVQFHNINIHGFGAYGLRVLFSSHKLAQAEELREALKKEYPLLSIEIVSYEKGKFYLEIARFSYKSEDDIQVVRQVNIVAANAWERLKSSSSPITPFASSAVGRVTEAAFNVGLEEATRPGGIDLSQIELTLKDEKFISSLNPAERKILLAGKYLKQGWDSLSLLYIHEIMLLIKDNLIKDIQNRDLLFHILKQLQTQDFLDPQALQFLNFLHSQKPLSEIKVALYR